MPPVILRMIDSKRNCKRILPDDAPTDLRIPISRVRSETETSMMFIIPIPPTTREIDATRVSIPETIDRRDPAGCMSSALVIIEKLWSPFFASESCLWIDSVIFVTESVFSARTSIC